MSTTPHGHSIGLTGNIACGKSSVAHRLAEHGATVIDADVVAHALMRPEMPAWRDVVAAFGESILASDGTIDRSRLRTIVFSDRLALQRLNAAVHPHVHTELLRRIHSLRPDEVAVIEAVALIEAGTYHDMDSLWLVLCRPEQQIARLVRERHLTPEDAVWRVAGQPPAEAKAALADVVLHNDGSMQHLREQTDAAWHAALQQWQVRTDRVGSA